MTTRYPWPRTGAIDIEDAIGDEFATQRIVMGLTQMQVQDLLGVSTAHVSRVELGTRRVKVVDFLRLSILYGQSPARLLAKFEPMARDQWDERKAGLPDGVVPDFLR